MTDRPLEERLEELNRAAGMAAGAVTIALHEEIDRLRGLLAATEQERDEARKVRSDAVHATCPRANGVAASSTTRTSVETRSDRSIVRTWWENHATPLWWRAWFSLLLTGGAGANLRRLHFSCSCERLGEASEDHQVGVQSNSFDAAHAERGEARTDTRRVGCPRPGLSRASR